MDNAIFNRWKSKGIFEALEEWISENYDNEVLAFVTFKLNEGDIDLKDYETFEEFEQLIEDIDSGWDHKYNTITYNKEEWLVLDDYDADKLFEERCISMLDECWNIDKHIRPYIDEERWVRDCGYDGRGHMLAGYDGYEHDVKVNGDYWYLYRTN